MRALIDETRIVLLTDVAPAPVRCEIGVYLSGDRRLWTDGPHADVTLLRVEFADGAICDNDSDHARLVASRYEDPAWEHHLAWPDIVQGCREQYRNGNSYLARLSFKEAA